MTRQDYILLATAFRSALDRNEDTAQSGILDAAHLVSVELALDNPRFNREHFLAVVKGEKPLNSRPNR